MGSYREERVRLFSKVQKGQDATGNIWAICQEKTTAVRMGLHWNILPLEVAGPLSLKEMLRGQFLKALSNLEAGPSLRGGLYYMNSRGSFQTKLVRGCVVQPITSHSICSLHILFFSLLPLAHPSCIRSTLASMSWDEKFSLVFSQLCLFTLLHIWSDICGVI